MLSWSHWRYHNTNKSLLWWFLKELAYHMKSPWRKSFVRRHLKRVMGGVLLPSPDSQFTAWYASKSIDEVLRQEIWLFSESRQAKKMADQSLKTANLSRSGSQEQGEKKEFEFQEWGSQEKCIRLTSRWCLSLPSALELTQVPIVRQVKSKTQKILQGFGYKWSYCRAQGPMQTRIPSCPPRHGTQQCSASPRSKALRR